MNFTGRIKPTDKDIPTYLDELKSQKIGNILIEMLLLIIFFRRISQIDTIFSRQIILRTVVEITNFLITMKRRKVSMVKI
jgi:hypothetical protein